MTDIELAKSKLKEQGETEILKEIETLSQSEKEEIAKQINQINFEEINNLYKQTKKDNTIKTGNITPIKYIDYWKLSKEEKEKYQKQGEQIIKNNQYAVVTMAGGQGTRLGWKGPKGTYKLNIGKKGKYIFEILTENIMKAKKMYNILPYWYIMTSEQNNEETQEFLEQNNYFGYEKEKVQFFKQGELPMLTEEGKMVLENNKIKTGSNGNGGIYSAMKKQNVIEDMRKKGVKWVYICGVDNIMVNPISPVLIGATIEKKLEIASKSVAKAYPEEKVGVFCKRNNKPSIVEYIELSEEMRNQKDAQGELVYGEANILSHLLSLEAIEKIANHDLQYHIALKKGLYKFESFIFDGFEYLEDMLVMRVKREDEFAPIKNKEGVDSPETAKKIYELKEKKDGRA